MARRCTGIELQTDHWMIIPGLIEAKLMRSTTHPAIRVRRGIRAEVATEFERLKPIFGPGPAIRLLARAGFRLIGNSWIGEIASSCASAAGLEILSARNIAAGDPTTIKFIVGTGSPILDISYYA